MSYVPFRLQYDVVRNRRCFRKLKFSRKTRMTRSCSDRYLYLSLSKDREHSFVVKQLFKF